MQAAGFQNVYALNGNVEDQIGFGTFDEKNENKVYWFGDKLHELNVPYPVTKLVCCRQMMATVSDMLRLYSVRDGIVLERELTKVCGLYYFFVNIIYNRRSLLDRLLLWIGIKSIRES